MKKQHTRQCPKCNKLLTYKSKQGCKNASEKNSPCRSCSAIEVNSRPGIRDYFIKRFATKGENVGEDNPFYGKTHSDEAKQKMKTVERSSAYITDEFRKKRSARASGENNPMFGKSYYDIWVKKYGEERAKELQLEKIRKNSIASSGKNNPMFGKSAPCKSGNGWKGWFDGHYFRSLHELSFLKKLIESGDKFRSGESRDLTIKYTTWKGEEGTYRADFLVNEKILVECKPKKLWNSPTVIAKKEGAELFCKKIGYEYKLIDPDKLHEEELIQMVQAGKLKFDKRYQERFELWITKRNYTL